MATTEEKRAALVESIRQLAGDVRFKVFVESLKGARDRAIQEACFNENVANSLVTAAYIGEIRAYVDIFNAIDEHAETSMATD